MKTRPRYIKNNVDRRLHYKREDMRELRRKIAEMTIDDVIQNAPSSDNLGGLIQGVKNYLLKED